VCKGNGKAIRTKKTKIYWQLLNQSYIKDLPFVWEVGFCFLLSVSLTGED
jgi:hypothetical protein